METTMTKRKPRIIYEVSYGESSNTENGFECLWQEEKDFTNIKDLKLFLNKLKYECIEWVIYVHIYTYSKGNEYHDEHELEIDPCNGFSILDMFAAYEERN